MRCGPWQHRADGRPQVLRVSAGVTGPGAHVQVAADTMELGQIAEDRDQQEREGF